VPRQQDDIAWQMRRSADAIAHKQDLSAPDPQDPIRQPSGGVQAQRLRAGQPCHARFIPQRHAADFSAFAVGHHGGGPGDQCLGQPQHAQQNGADHCCGGHPGPQSSRAGAGVVDCAAHRLDRSDHGGVFDLQRFSLCPAVGGIKCGPRTGIDPQNGRQRPMRQRIARARV
jgi:hypothetical protein